MIPTILNSQNQIKPKIDSVGLRNKVTTSLMFIGYILTHV